MQPEQTIFLNLQEPRVCGLGYMGSKFSLPGVVDARVVNVSQDSAVESQGFGDCLNYTLTLNF